MKYAYLEPSAVSHVARLSLAATEIREGLAEAGYVPAVGIHVVYELARASRRAGSERRGGYAVEASYCQALVSCDEQLCRTAPRLNPDLLVLDRSFVEGLAG